MPFFAEIFHRVSSAVAGDFLGLLALLGIGVADDHGAAARLVLQTQRNVIEDALADVCRCAMLSSGLPNAQSAVADLARLRRRRHSLHLDHRRAIRGAAAAIVHAHCDRLVPRSEARRIEVHCRARAHDLAGVGAPGVGQRIAVRIAGIRGDVNLLAGENRSSVSRARDCRRMVWLGLDADQETLELAEPPRPSSTFAVIVHDPTGTPAESQRTLAPSPSTLPQVDVQV